MQSVRTLQESSLHVEGESFVGPVCNLVALDLRSCCDGAASTNGPAHPV